MTDEALDALLKSEIDAHAPAPDWVRDRIAEAHGETPGPRWIQPLIGLAAAAAVLLAALPAIEGAWTDPAPIEASPAAPQASLPTLTAGQRLQQLPDDVPTAQGFPLPGDRVDLFVAHEDADGRSKAMTFLQDLAVASVDPVVLIVSPDQAERIAHSAQLGRITLGIARTTHTEVLLRPESPPIAGASDYIDVLVTLMQPDGTLETHTLFEELLVLERLGSQLRVVVTPSQAESLALAQHMGKIATSVHP